MPSRAREAVRRGGARVAGGDQREHQRGRHEAAAQVVEDHPARQRAERIADRAAVGARCAREEPARDLPVAARPAVPAVGVGQDAGGFAFDELDVAEEAAACVAAFDQVVAEDAVLGKRPPVAAWKVWTS